MQVNTLSHYVDALRASGLLLRADLSLKEQATDVDFITYDSKEVRPGTLFVCKGAHFKPEYLDEAIEQGAFAYVSESLLREDHAALIVHDIRQAMAVLANLFYEEPWRAYRTTAVTGTKGKSTVVHYIKSILDTALRAADEQDSGLVSTIRIQDGMVDEEAHLTTPESLVLMRHLANARTAGLHYMTLEVSSQALKYHRVSGLLFDVGVFLNISEDHISPEEHSDYADYFAAKLKLFGMSKHMVYSLDSEEQEALSEAATLSPTRASISMKNEAADYFAYEIKKEKVGFTFKLDLQGKTYEFKLPTPGVFNVENALAAIAVADHYGIAVESMQKALAEVRVEGRMEYFASRDGLLHIIVDYAHNALSFERLFKSIKGEYPNHQICVVFGCGGGKALPRRAQLGRATAAMSDRIILTSEDPGYEEPRAIADDIGQYITAAKRSYEFIEERGAAIRHAVQSSDAATIILVLGKGGERYQKIGAHWVEGPSDLDYAAEYIAEYDEAH